jgi:predicted enzyme related to lactoylglutathione lyase
MKSVYVGLPTLAVVIGLTASYAKEKESDGQTTKKRSGERVMQIHYLEIVTKEVDAVCASYEAANGVDFGEPIAALGNARTTALPGGGMLGVRAPMHDAEEPLVRPYWLVDDIKDALDSAVKAGGEVAHPPLEIPGIGTFAIYIQGGVNHGLWQR